MLPVLFTFGNWPISSFGLFLALSLFLASFFIWRITRVYDLNEERSLDLILLTFFGGLLFARIYFVLFHLSFFILLNSPVSVSLFQKTLRILLINKYPGLSFWGGFFGGTLTLSYFVRRFKLEFWETADFAMVGLFLGMAISSFGCFLGGCEVGVTSRSIIAVSMAGLAGKHLPIQLVEMLLFGLSFIYLWKGVLRFHFAGKIFAVGLIFMGIVKFVLEFYRGDRQVFWYPWALGHVYSLIVIGVGVWAFYFKGNRSFSKDLGLIKRFMIDSRYRANLSARLSKGWYNRRVNTKIAIKEWRREMRKRLNIKSTPPGI